SADTRGVEASLRWQARPWWSIEGSASTFHLTPHPAPDTTDPTAATNDGSAPAYQWQLRSNVSFSRQFNVLGAAYGVGRIVSRDGPAYRRVDLQADWQATPSLLLAVGGQNLFVPRHVEFGGQDLFATPTLVSPTVSVRVTWTIGR